MASKKYKIKTGDTVTVVAGNSKGKTGKVQKVLTEKDRIIVEGVNIVSKHVKPSAQNPNGGIEREEAAIHISNVMLVDPASGDTVRVGRKADEKGKLQRYSKKSGEFIK